MVKVGCCGWSYISAKDYFGEDWKDKFKSKLQAYAALFDVCEINSTFYKLPKLLTAEKWAQEAREINKKFEFTVKANKVITHQDKFSSQSSILAFYGTKKICEAVKAKIMLIQMPASFKSKKENVKKVENFFSKIKRDKLIIAIEPRGFDDKTIREICRKFDLVHCVDPFAKEPLAFSKNRIAYFRLHGVPPGKRMYYYQYTKKDLMWLKKVVNKLSKLNEIYVMFNNVWMYQSALDFLKT